MGERAGSVGCCPHPGAGAEGGSLPAHRRICGAVTRRCCRADQGRSPGGGKPRPCAGVRLPAHRAATAAARAALAAGHRLRLWGNSGRHGAGAGAHPTADTCRGDLARAQQCRGRRQCHGPCHDAVADGSAGTHPRWRGAHPATGTPGDASAADGWSFPAANAAPACRARRPGDCAHRLLRAVHPRAARSHRAGPTLPFCRLPSISLHGRAYRPRRCG